jgi:hypothetical protein
LTAPERFEYKEPSLIRLVIVVEIADREEESEAELLVELD